MSRPSPKALAVSNSPLAQFQRSPLEGIRPANLAAMLEKGGTSTQQRIVVKETRNRLAAQEGHTLLHAYADEKIAQAHLHTFSTYATTSRALDYGVASFAVNKASADDLTEWAGIQRAMLRRHLAGNLEGVVQRVVELSMEPIYKDEKRGWLKRLLVG